MDKKKELVFRIFDPPTPKMSFLTKNAIFRDQGEKPKKIIMDSYVHYIYKDIVWYESLIHDIFMTAKNGGSVPKNAVFGH